jgi:DNA-binding CsgD family transcriptional regulator
MPLELPHPAEIQRIHHLIHDLCEAGGNTHIWREKMAVAIEEMVNAQMSLSYLFGFSLDPSDIAPKALLALPRGFNQVWLSYLAAGDLTGDPVTPHIMQRIGTDFTVTRQELVDDETWTASKHYRQVIVPSDIGDLIYSHVAVKDPRVVDGFSLIRTFDQPRFDTHDVAVVRYVHSELGRLWNRQDPIGIHTLPARQREVLYAIRRGDSRRAIASKMRVSESTVHTYEKALFDRAGVTSRGELNAAMSVIVRPNLLP